MNPHPSPNWSQGLNPSLSQSLGLHTCPGPGRGQGQGQGIQVKVSAKILKWEREIGRHASSASTTWP